MIQRENAEGPNLFAKFINIFYTNIPIANSVKNRTETIVKLIEDGVKLAEENGEEFYSLSIGCGPALEVKKFLETNSPKVKCHFRLLDFNEETLNFAINQANKAGRNKFCEITGELNSVHELLKRSISKKSEEEKYNLVYCSGLFDYLSDRICSKLIKLFFLMTKQNGKVFVTNMNFNNHNYLMELLFEWYLIYRDEKTVASFTPELGEQKIFTDETGVNICLEITK
jgi:extracellular factor (EF) 3-hydroxypalmitic acid methyl ester biosynthesis protein